MFGKSEAWRHPPQFQNLWQCNVMLLCCDVGTLTSGVMLCYVCYVVTCHTAQRDTPRDRVSIVTAESSLVL